VDDLPWRSSPQTAGSGVAVLSNRPASDDLREVAYWRGFREKRGGRSDNAVIVSFGFEIGESADRRRA